MSITTDKTEEVKTQLKPSIGGPVVKDVWTVSDGDYTPKFLIKSCLLTGGVALKYKLRLDDTADVVTFEAEGRLIVIGDVISAQETGTTATSVTWYG